MIFLHITGLIFKQMKLLISSICIKNSVLFYFCFLIISPGMGDEEYNNHIYKDTIISASVFIRDFL